MQPVTAGTSGGRLVLGAALLVLLVLVTGPGGVSCVQVHHQYGLQFPCKFQIQPDTTEDVECDGGGDRLTIRSGDVRKSTGRLSIVNYYTVIVEAGALETMKSQGSVFFENIETLSIQGRSLPDQRNHPFKQGPISVSLNNISFVAMGTGSLSHWLNISVSIANANKCMIHNNAIVSNSKASSMQLTNITDGQFYSGTFGTTLGTLSLTNVTVKLPCQNRTFSGSIGRLSLKRVHFVSVGEGCFDASRMWKSLSVLSSYLGDIDERGTHGRIEDVNFQETNFGRIKPRGIELNVTRLTMNASSVVDLSGYGLAVRASHTILIQKSVISEVRTNAFRGLTLTTQNRSIQLAQLVLGKSSEGFLRVSDINAVDLKDIYLDVPCRCDIRRQVCQSFYNRSCPDPLSQDGKRMLRLAFRNIRCMNGSTNTYMLDYNCLYCDNPFSFCKDRDRGAMDSDDRDFNDRDSDAVDGDAETDNTSSAAGASSWTWLVTIPVCLLIGAGVAVLAIRCRRRSLPPQRRPPREEKPPSQQLTSADLRDRDPATHPSSLPELQMSGTPVYDDVTNSRGRDSPVYEEVSDFRGPDSPVYEDMARIGGSASPVYEVMARVRVPERLYENQPALEMTQTGTGAESRNSSLHPLYAEINERIYENC